MTLESPERKSQETEFAGTLIGWLVLKVWITQRKTFQAVPMTHLLPGDKGSRSRAASNPCSIKNLKCHLVQGRGLVRAMFGGLKLQSPATVCMPCSDYLLSLQDSVQCNLWQDRFNSER